MRKCLYTYAWDFVGEGVDTVLTNIKSLGINAIAMAVSYHAGKFILPHNPNSRVYFPEDGTVYFMPNAKCYSGILKPAVSSVLESKNVLQIVAEKCKEYDIKLHAWTVCMHNTRLGSKFPVFTVQNAFGDHYPYSLCPAQPEVAKYALSLINDLSENYDLNTIFLESLGYMGFAHGYHHEFFGVQPNLCAQSLLSLCFCNECSEKARKSGIDVERVRQICRDYIDSVINGEQTDPNIDIDQFVDMNPELAAYIKMRCEVVTDLVKQVKTIACKNNVRTDYFGPVFEPSCKRAYVEGIDLPAITSVVDHYIIPVGSSDLNALKDDIEHVIPFTTSEKIAISINLGPSATPTPENLHQKVSCINMYNLDGCNLYNYSTIPFNKLDWLKEI